MTSDRSGRWQSVYDADGLARAIRELARELNHSPFYDLPMRGPPVCQGDIVSLDCDVPHIDEDGELVGMAGTGLWLVIGNTCDLSRDLSDVEWTQVVPLVDAHASKLSADRVRDMREYKLARRFYVPTWPGSTIPDVHYFADLLRPVPLHRLAFTKHAVVRARMSELAWVLLHSCLVRFLARDDGRFDPG